jgi:hypothetical protein
MSDPTVKVICHSISPDNIPLVTVHMRYWRAVHAELMTHRVFSRNARSSRAVPVQKMLDEIMSDPFIPKHWGKNQKGMQASEECNEPVIIQKPMSLLYEEGPEIGYWGDALSREEAWLEARDKAVQFGEAFMTAGYHKQLVNRLLEPFMWIDTLVTSTDWANFFALRDHKDAEPHIRDLAQATKEAITASTPQKLDYDQWHVPYVDAQIEDDGQQSYRYHFSETGIVRGFKFMDVETARKVSGARCARISYAPFDGNGSIAAELERFDKLVTNWPVHASPVEHQATPDRLINEAWTTEWANPQDHRNFRGWRQFRSMIPNETVRD